MWLPILLPTWTFCAIIAMVVAKTKGRNQVLWFFLGILFGPLCFAVVFLPSLISHDPPPPESPFQLTESGEISLENETKQCPQCALEIPFEAERCSQCGLLFDPSEVAQAMEALRADLREKWDQGFQRCPTCRKWDVHEAFLEDGSWGDWCPHCSRSIKRMKEDATPPKP